MVIRLGRHGESFKHNIDVCRQAHGLMPRPRQLGRPVLASPHRGPLLFHALALGRRIRPSHLQHAIIATT